MGAAVWLAPVLTRAADPTVAAAVREAMHLAVERGIASASRPHGFLANPAIRIPVPEPLTKVETKLRLAGEDRTVEKFIASLNHVAEEATPAARPTLLTAVAELPADDAHRALAGGESAGTDLLRRVAFGRVVNALNPAVAGAMSHTRVARRYKRFVRDSPVGGLFQQASVDLDAYVVGRTADGIFHVIGDEERRIRLDPSARPTARLRDVFGAHR